MRSTYTSHLLISCESCTNMNTSRSWRGIFFLIFILVIDRVLSQPPRGSRGHCQIRCGASGSRPGNFNEDDEIDRSAVRGGYPRPTRHGSSSTSRQGNNANSHGNHIHQTADRDGVPGPAAPATRYYLPQQSEAFDLGEWFQSVYDAYHRSEHPAEMQTHRFVMVISHLGIPVWIDLIWIWTNQPQEIDIVITVPTPDNISPIYRQRLRRIINRMTIRTSLFSLRTERGTGLPTPRLIQPQALNAMHGDHQRLLPNELGARAPFSTWHYDVLSDGQEEDLRVGHMGEDYLHHLADGHGPLHEYFSDSDDSRGSDNEGHGHHHHGVPDAVIDHEPQYSIETFNRRFLVSDIFARRSTIIMLQSTFIIEDEPLNSFRPPSSP